MHAGIGQERKGQLKEFVKIVQTEDKSWETGDGCLHCVRAQNLNLNAADI